MFQCVKSNVDFEKVNFNEDDCQACAEGLEEKSRRKRRRKMALYDGNDTLKIISQSCLESCRKKQR